jgi:Fe-S cluster assembly ATPase SufC
MDYTKWCNSVTREEWKEFTSAFKLAGVEVVPYDYLIALNDKRKIAILDEPDSGLDIDAVRIVAANIDKLQKEKEMGMLVITHYSRILEYLNPKFIHIMKEGKIVREGGRELISEIEKSGYSDA